MWKSRNTGVGRSRTCSGECSPASRRTRSENDVRAAANDRLRHGAEPKGTGDGRVVEADDRDVRRFRRAGIDGGAGAQGERVGGADEGGDTALEQLPGGTAGVGHVVGALRRERREIEVSESVPHRPLPAGEAVATDVRPGRPRQVADPDVAVGHEVAGDRVGPGGAIDIHPVVRRIGRVGMATPRPAERHERQTCPTSQGMRASSMRVEVSTTPSISLAARRRA